MQLLRNSVIDALTSDIVANAQYRVLGSSPDGEQTVLFELNRLPDSPKPFLISTRDLEAGLESGGLRHHQYPLPEIMYLDEGELSSPEKEHRDVQYDSIEPFVTDNQNLLQFASRGKSRVVVNFASDVDLPYKSCIRRLNTYWERGLQPNAMLPQFRNCGGPGKEKSASTKARGRPVDNGKYGLRQKKSFVFDDPDKKILRSVLRECVKEAKANQTRIQYSRIYLKFKQETPYCDEIKFANSEGRPAYIPNLDQIRYWSKLYLKKMDISKALTPANKWEKDYRALLDSVSFRARVPGARYEIDSTVANVYVVCEFNRHVLLGRPTIYIVVDQASRMIVGFFVTLEPPSWKTARQALYNAFSSKVPYCARYGISIDESDWPSIGVPARILADGGEMTGDKPKVVVNQLGVTVEIAASYRADAKGIVERRFGIANDDLNFIPGTTLGEMRERGDHDPRLDAVLTLNEVTEILASAFIKHNKTHQFDDLRTKEMIAADIAPTPLNFWNFHLQANRHALNYHADASLIAGLLPSIEASITRRGILANGMRYGCNRALEEEWYSRSCFGEAPSIEAHGDLSWSSDIFVRVEGELSYIRCRLLPAERLYADNHPDDLEFLDEWTKAKKETADKDAMELEHASRSDTIVQFAASEKKLHPKPETKTARIAGIRKHRKEAIERSSSTSQTQRAFVDAIDCQSIDRVLSIVSSDEVDDK